MLSAMRIFRLILTIITFVSGTLTNFSMLAVYLKRWQHTRNSIVYDTILLSAVLMNISLQVSQTLDGILDTFEIFVIFGKNVFLFMFMVQFSLLYANAWNTTWLSMFYYSRLVNISHPYLLKVKALFLSSVTRLIIGSVLSSITINLPFFWLIEADIVANKTMTTPMSGYKIKTPSAFTIFNSLIGYVLPLTLTCICIGRCVMTLLGHVWRVNLNESQPSLTSSQLQGHIRAARTMIMRVVVDLTFYFIVIIGLLKSFNITIFFNICSCISVLMYPTAQSLILIHGNPKLKTNICRLCTSN